MLNVTPDKISRKPGRPKFSAGRDTYQPELLVAGALDAIKDGQLLMTSARIGFALGGVSEKTVERWINAGALPSVSLQEKFGRKVCQVRRVPAELLIQWVRARYPETI